jgi:phytoene synthase
MIPAAVRHCERVTRREARNFWYGIRLLPADKRHAMAAVYAMSRRIDDAGDGGLSPDRAAAALEEIERSLRRLDPASPDPIVAGVALAARRFPALPLDAFGDLVAGVRMDLHGTRYGTFDDLETYCRRVAGSVGRLSLGIFGTKGGARAWSLADDLGVAMQLVNVLRDVREDFGRGRVYLPAEDLERFGVVAADLAGPARPATVALLGFEADRAGRWFRRGLPLLSLLDRRSAACAGAMAGIYVELLKRIARRPDAVLAGRVSLPVWRKGLVAAAALGGVHPHPGTAPGAASTSADEVAA